jgi:hypothetical protein
MAGPAPTAGSDAPVPTPKGVWPWYNAAMGEKLKPSVSPGALDATKAQLLGMALTKIALEAVARGASIKIYVREPNAPEAGPEQIAALRAQFAEEPDPLDAAVREILGLRADLRRLEAQTEADPGRASISEREPA